MKIQVFEDNRSFGEVIEHLKADDINIAWRAGWNGKDMWIRCQFPDEYSKMQRPYIYMKPVDNKLVPWLASQSDMLEDDWVLGFIED